MNQQQYDETLYKLQITPSKKWPIRYTVRFNDPEHGERLTVQMFTLEGFIEALLVEAKEYGRKEKLVWALSEKKHDIICDQRVTELLELFVSGKPLFRKGSGHRGKWDRDHRNRAIWRRLHFYRGMGYAIRNKTLEPPNDACTEVGREFSVSPEQVNRVWKKYGGNKPITLALEMDAILSTQFGEHEIEVTK